MGVSGFISRVDKKSGTTLKLLNINRNSVTQHSYHITPAQVIIEELKKWIMLQTEAF